MDAMNESGDHLYPEAESFQEPLRPRSIALRITLWTWASIIAGYFIGVILSPYLGLGVLLILLFLVYAGMAGLFTGAGFAIFELIKRQTKISSFIALALCSPAFFMAYNVAKNSILSSFLF